jgi:RNA polymerase sigma factor (sigma-70 family)
VDPLVEDRPLLAAFRGGERTALGVVYSAYAPDLFGFLSRGFRVESSGKPFWFAGYKGGCELEDAVQEVFARAFSDAARLSYDGLRPYRNYLFTIARNFIIDELRKRQRVFLPIGEESSGGPDAPPLIDDAPSPEQQWLDNEVKDIVVAFVAELSGDERRVFASRFQGGMSVEATAKALQLSEFRVKRLERQLRKRFFGAMRSRGYFDGYQLKNLVTNAVPLLLALVSGGLR